MRFYLIIVFGAFFLPAAVFAQSLQMLPLEPTLKVYPAPTIETQQPVPGTSAAVTFEGVLEGGRVAIGGETTGWVLHYQDATGAQSVEFDPGSFASSVYDGIRIRVTGDIVMRSTVERGTVSVFVASQMEVVR